MSKAKSKHTARDYWYLPACLFLLFHINFLLVNIMYIHNFESCYQAYEKLERSASPLHPVVLLTWVDCFKSQGFLMVFSTVQSNALMLPFFIYQLLTLHADFLLWTMRLELLFCLLYLIFCIFHLPKIIISLLSYEFCLQQYSLFIFVYLHITFLLLLWQITTKLVF